MNNLEMYLKIIAYVLIVISGVILLFKLLFNKADKNKNGKIDKEEIESSNLAYVMSFLIDTLKIITKGIVNDTGCKVATAEKLIAKALKNQDSKKIEKEIVDEFNNQEKIKEQEENDKKLELEMLKKQKFYNDINTKIIEEQLNEQGENNNA